jgi:transposase-like protein
LPLHAGGDHSPPNAILTASLSAASRDRPSARGKGIQVLSIGFFHIDIAEIQTAEGKLYLFVAIDRTSKFAFVRLVDKANRVTASAFLTALINSAIQDPHCPD